MPSNWLAIDTNFPTFSGQESTEKKVTSIQNYMFLLVEQLRYTLFNLDEDNFNPQGLQNIYEPVYAKISDTEMGLQSELALTAEGLGLRITSAEGQITSLQVTTEGLSARVTDNEGNLSLLQQTVESFAIVVTNGETSSLISLTANGAVVSSQSISMNGMVTFSGLADGTTTINGACIQTGLISANRLNLTGAITWSDLSSGVQQDIDDALSKADDAQTTANNVNDTVSGWTYGSTTYIDGSMIKTGTVMASSLLGGEVGLLDQHEDELGHITIGSASSSSSRIEFVSERALYLEAGRGDLYLTSPNGYITFDSADYVTSRNSICPTSSGGANLGSSGFLWGVVYAESGTINTSDQNKKHDIVYDLKAYDSFFDQLKPTSFLFDNGTSGRRHIGFVAQDIEQALTDCGINSMEFAGFVKSPLEDGNYLYGLRYAEFVSLNTWQIQKLKAGLHRLETEVKGLKGEN